MAQYYQINLDDLKHLNLDNCVFMSDDGTLNSQSVTMTNPIQQTLLNCAKQNRVLFLLLFVFCLKKKII